jgi:UDP-sugar diphosphatase
MKKSVEIVEISKVDDENSNLYNFVYIQNGEKISTKVTKPLDVVKILIYNKDRDAFVITRQFRPLVYINNPDMAYRYELCGGGCDKEGLSAKEVAIEEVYEEVGYKVDDLKEITNFYTGSKITLYYVEVDDSMIATDGGGVDDEDIEVIYLPISEAKEFLFNPNIPKRPALAFSFCWFFNWRS